MSIQSFAKYKNIHMVGIKGVGMTALAEVLLKMGKKVSGSDVAKTFFTDRVIKYLGIETQTFAKENISKKIDLIVYSPAYSVFNNEELAAASAKNIPIISYPEALGALFRQSRGVAVCGSHGKTTTTAMVGLVAKQGNLDPTVIVGTQVPQFDNKNALVGASDLLIAETCEYREHFLNYQPQEVILTNIDYDHPDFFKTPQSYFEAFRKFIAQLPKDGILYACWEDEQVRKIIKETAKSKKVISYGLKKAADFQAKNIHYGEGKILFEAYRNGEFLDVFELQVPGKHNALNALAVIAWGWQHGIPTQKIKETLGSFVGTVRRFERKGEKNGAIVIDDYGHHPTEIEATLRAAKKFYPLRKIWCVFQPHTFSRTEALFQNFVSCFKAADVVIINDIFTSARERTGRINGRDLADGVRQYNPETYYIAGIDDTVRFLQERLGKNDLLITMGAGHGDKVAEGVLEG